MSIAETSVVHPTTTHNAEPHPEPEPPPTIMSFQDYVRTDALTPMLVRVITEPENNCDISTYDVDMFQGKNDSEDNSHLKNTNDTMHIYDDIHDYNYDTFDH